MHRLNKKCVCVCVCVCVSNVCARERAKECRVKRRINIAIYSDKTRMHTLYFKTRVHTLYFNIKCQVRAERQGKEKKTVADQHLSTEEEEAVHRLEKKCVHVSTSKVIETNVEKDHNL